MKKTILSMAFMMLASTFALTTNAQNITSTPASAECNQKECVNPQDCKKACPFDGLNLTAEQQEKVKDLNNALEVSRKNLKQEAKAENTEMKDRRKELRQKYIDDLQEILTADQFVTYLKNYYVNQAGPRPQKVGKGVKPVFDKSAKNMKRDLDKRVKGERK